MLSKPVELICVEIWFVEVMLLVEVNVVVSGTDVKELNKEDDEASEVEEIILFEFRVDEISELIEDENCPVWEGE